jgi:MIP family channel proteins
MKTSDLNKFLRPHVAEFIGTFLLVFAGCAAILAGKLSTEGVVLTFALVIATMVYAMGPISGAQFNPAVSIGLATGGHQSWLRAGTFIVAQCLGAILAAAMLRFAFGTSIAAAVNNPAASTSVGEAFLFEAIFTAVLVIVITAVATGKGAPRETAALAIGGAIALAGFAAGPITSASVNPARSLGPALIAGDFTNLWLFIAAPIVGGIAAGLIFRFIRVDSTES